MTRVDAATSITQLVLLDELLSAIKTRTPQRILVVGPPGCGKTRLADRIGTATSIACVRRTDTLIETHSTDVPVGAPSDAERAAPPSAAYARISWDCALLAEVRRWLAEPGPWIIEGRHAMLAWVTAIDRRGAPAGVDAAILCATPTRPPATAWGFVRRRRDIVGWWEGVAPNMVFTGGLMWEWVPPGAAECLRALAIQMRASCPGDP